MKVLPRERGDAYWRRVALEEKGMKGSTYRMRRMKGMSAMEAALKPVKEVTPVLTNPNSAAQTAKRYGLGKNAIFDYKRRNPDTTLSYEEIAQVLAENKERREKAKAFNDRCRAKGLEPRTVRDWMTKYSMTEEQALGRKPMSRRERGRRNAKITKDRRKGSNDTGTDSHQATTESRPPL